MSLILYRTLKKQFLLETSFTTDDAMTRTPNSQPVCLLPESRAPSNALTLPLQCQGKADVQEDDSHQPVLGLC